MAKFNAAFWKWFGRSRVVDKYGQPLVVYHGTDAKFNEFSYTNDIGYHFGSKKTAMARLRQVGMKRGFLMPVYLRIENPLELPDLGLWETEEVANALFDAKVLTFEQYRKHLHYLDQEDVQKLLAAKGYDGIVYPNKTEKGGDSYIVFDSRQIKSVDNAGTWSRTDPDIRWNPIALPFFSTCVDWPRELMPALTYLIDQGEDISRSTFLRYVDKSYMKETEEGLGYGSWLKMKDDYAVSYERLPDWPVVWFNHSAIENVFAEQETIERLSEFAFEKGF